ncbi:MAG TPA: hypothetical protein VK858_15540 [Longimicrobiales bacterium]|nr:hypothetical protein [Longimicrobiales bacterium]
MHRRAFLRALPVAGVAALLLPREVIALRRRFDHPEPRPGIDGSGVISEEQLRAEGNPDAVIELYNGIREMPEIADGLACYCGCMLLGNRSLLTCYHERGMARGCNICQGEARLAIGRYREGQSLDQIRRAIDARYG